MEKATEAYQKTVEKTSSLFAKVKENTAIKGIGESVGGLYQTARSKIPGVGGGGGELDEAFKEGEKAAAATAGGEGGEAGGAAPPPAQDQQQMA